MLAFTIFLFAQPAIAVLKKCVDDQGKSHYYNNFFPPECSGKVTVEMNEHGVVINRIEETTLQSTEEEKSKRLVEAQRLADEQNQDAILLNIYVSAEEIDLALERNLYLIELAVNSVAERLKIAKVRLDSLQKQAKEAVRMGSSNLAFIRKKIIPVQRKVKNLQKELQDNQERKVNIKAKFEADKQRFLVLTGNNNK